MADSPPFPPLSPAEAELHRVARLATWLEQTRRDGTLPSFLIAMDVSGPEPVAHVYAAPGLDEKLVAAALASVAAALGRQAAAPHN